MDLTEECKRLKEEIEKVKKLTARRRGVPTTTVATTATTATTTGTTTTTGSAAAAAGGVGSSGKSAEGEMLPPLPRGMTMDDMLHQEDILKLELKNVTQVGTTVKR